MAAGTKTALALALALHSGSGVPTAERWGPRVVDLETTLRIPENKRDEFLQTVAPSASPSSAAAGGRAEFFLSLTDPGLILWIERWPSRDALVERLETNAFRVLMGAAKTLGRVLDIRIVDDPRTPMREAHLRRDGELEDLIYGEEAKKETP